MTRSNPRSIAPVPALLPACLGTLSGAMVLSSCSGLTRQEAREALEEVKLDSQSQALTGETVEVTTSFTIGKGVERAAEELREFLRSQLPCAAVELEAADGQATLTIEYGVSSDDCIYRGRLISGRHLVAIARNEADLVQVDHVWDELSDGRVEASGSATVEWDFENRSRRVVHSVRWTRLSDGRTGEGSGDRIQWPLPGGIGEGISVDGERHWKGRRGQWDLDIDGVEMRWADPVPQSGSYKLDTPFGKQLGLAFARQDERTIRVTINGPRRSFDFDVVALPDGGEATESRDGDGGG